MLNTISNPYRLIDKIGLFINLSFLIHDPLCLGWGMGVCRRSYLNGVGSNFFAESWDVW